MLRARRGPAFLPLAPLHTLRAPRRAAVTCRARHVMSAAARPAPGATTLYVKAGSGGSGRGDCPFSAKALLALRVKGVEYVEQWVDLADKPSWYLELNPDGTVPTLVAPDAEVVASSDEIVALADEVGVGGVRLYREESPEWEAAGGVIGPVFGAFARLMKNKEEEEEEGLKAVLVSALKAVDAHLETCGGPYLLGAEISAMDLNFGPKVHHIVVAGMAYKGVGIAEYKNVQRLFDAIRETDAWKETACADEEVVRGWSRFFE